MNDSSQEEVSIRDIRILPNLNASYLPVMPDGSVLLVDNVWCVTDFVVSYDAHLAFCMFKLCYAIVSVCLSCFCRSVWSCCFRNTCFLFCLCEHCVHAALCLRPQPSVGWGWHGVFLQGGQPGWPPSQHAQCFGGAWLLVPASPQRHPSRWLQWGLGASDFCFTRGVTVGIMMSVWMGVPPLWCECHYAASVWFWLPGTGGSPGCCAAVVDSQNAFHQLHLHTLQVRKRRGWRSSLWSPVCARYTFRLHNMVICLMRTKAAKINIWIRDQTHEWLCQLRIKFPNL